ncbi:hypothetical protein ET989_13550 [Propioniciclava sinopodophylli]|jgi:hypothetical protein|uniref:Uncharacterized protein n=1 Tax=Propioniciclava sinopodophylli TaxID=1837344 RepID=A0A4Q9KBM4_9ACTN|nr:hypothetical protein [Propioniciclava sinopodophylli]TBT82715.1 hypothetical protein ET989_13550 [Propioniciclava sinopodophylli]
MTNDARDEEITLTDDEMSTDDPSALAGAAPGDPDKVGDADGIDGGDADGTDGGDADGTDGDSTDGDSTDGTDGDSGDADGTDA